MMVFRSDSNSYMWAGIKTLITVLMLCAFWMIGKNIFGPIDIHIAMQFFLFIFVIALFYHALSFVTLIFYEIQIQIDNFHGKIFITQKALLTKRFSFDEKDQFHWVRFANGPQNSVIRSATGKEFGSLLSDRQKVQVLEYLNRVSYINGVGPRFFK